MATRANTGADQRVAPATGRRGPLRDGGFSLLELLISAAILIILVYVVTTLAISGNSSQKYAERLNRATEITQDLLDDIRTELRESVRLFHDDTVGGEYLAILAPWTAATPLASSRLPTLDATGVFNRDTVGAEKTGNQLCFVRNAWTTEYTVPTSSTTYRVDVYRVVRYFLKSEDGGPQPGSWAGLNFSRFVSEAMVDSMQIDQITNATDQAELLQMLLNGAADVRGRIHAPVQVVWRMGQSPSISGTFRQILSDGTMTITVTPPRPGVSWQILRDSDLSKEGFLTYRHHSVASNYAQANLGVGRFGLIDNTGTGFPHGFEVQMIGPASARQVLVNFTVVSTNRQGRTAAANLQGIADARDI
ncbi:MAG: type II secretion system protein [Planctomycetes bacterium]|nr:type II secretion system protein [Planctomycetota bacterium]